VFPEGTSFTYISGVTRILLFWVWVAAGAYAADLTAIQDTSAAGDSARAVALADTLHTDSLDQLTADRDAPDTVEYSAVDLQYDFPSQTFNLNDKALIKYRGALLTGDTIWFDQGKQVLQASGDPVLKDPKNPPLSGYRMKYNMKTRIGQVFYGSSFRENQRFNGIDIRRLPDNRLQLARGDFSTCNDSVHQHYYFYSRRMVVKPKEQIVAAPVVLNIGDVPVAVLPIMVAPLKSGRRSGLLTPKFGGDQAQGFYLRDLGFYWAINDYMDWKTSTDIVEGSEAKFERSSATSLFNYKQLYVLDGNISATAYMEQFDLANSGWDIRFNHKQNLRPDGKSVLSGSGSFVSSQRVRQDNALDASTILDQQANAQLTWSRAFANSRNMTWKLSQEHNLVTGNLTRQVPDFQFRTSGLLFPFLESDGSGTPGFFEKFNYSFSERANYYLHHTEDSLAKHDTTWLGNTFNFSTDWSGQVFRYINLRPSFQYQGDWSANQLVDPTDTLNPQRMWAVDAGAGQVGQYFGSPSWSVNADTKLYGIWRPEWGRFVGIRHTLSPGVSYTYAPRIDTNEYMIPHPLLGQRTWQGLQKTVGFSLGNNFDLKYLTTPDSTAKEGSRNLPILTTRHSTSYNFGADSLQWSDIGSTFGIQVVPDYQFSISTTHSVYHRFSATPSTAQIPELTYWNYDFSRSFRWNGQFSSGLFADTASVNNMRPWSASFDYHYSFGSRRVGRNLFQDEIRHSSSMSLTMQPTKTWNLTYSTSYDYDAGRFNSHVLTFNRDLHCWSMTFRWTPVGPASGWYFSIFITDLPDIKLQAGDTQT